MYGVETKVLKQAVKRTIERFPEDFMFVLAIEEFTNLRSQIVTSRWGGIRYSSMAFTERGVAILSSILRSKRAINKYPHYESIYKNARATLLRQWKLSDLDPIAELNSDPKVMEEK